jgi:hypothetical protein
MESGHLAASAGEKEKTAFVWRGFSRWGKNKPKIIR